MSAFSVTQEIKDRLDIVEIIGETVKLRRSGNSYSGFCPFHDNKNTPAFVVWPDTGVWKCFGACNESGDLFSFVMKRNGWDFRETLEHLARRANVELQPITPQQQEQFDQQERLHQLCEHAIFYYRNALLHNPQAEIARAYLEKRAVTAATSQHFELGYAPQSWDGLITHLTAKGYSTAEMLAAGVISHRDENDRVYDRFRHRLMIPIRDEKGRAVGFGARAFSDEDQPKYLNSPQSDIFDKSSVLYGLNLAKKAIREQGEAVLVEGYLDVISAHQAGFENVVCAMGTALTERQMRLLKQQAPRLILALDADAAGAKATLRGIEVAQEMASTDAPATFDGMGLLRNESQFKLEIRVALLPPGLDPDDVFRTQPEGWLDILRNSRSVIDHAMQTLSAGRDLSNPRVQAEFSDQILKMINLVGHPTERRLYRMRLANLLRVDESAILGEVSRPPGLTPPARQKPTRGQKSDAWERSDGRAKSQRAAIDPARLLPAQPTDVGNLLPENLNAPELQVELDAAQSYVIALLIGSPELLVVLDRNLRAFSLAALSEADFSASELRLALKMVRAALQQDEMLPASYAEVLMLRTLPEFYLQMQKLVQLGDVADDERQKLVVDSGLRLRKRNIEYWLQELRFLYQNAQADPHTEPDLVSLYAQEVVGQTQALSRLTHAFRSRAQRTSMVQTLTGKKQSHGKTSQKRQ